MCAEQMNKPKNGEKNNESNNGQGLSTSLLGRLRIRATRVSRMPTPFEKRVRLVMFALSCTIFLVMALLVAAMVTPIEETYTAQGVVRPGRYRRIYTSVDVEQRERPVVREGDYVYKGDVLMRFELPDMQYDILKTREELENLRAELKVQQSKTAAVEKLPLPKELWEIQEQLTKSKASLDYFATQLERSKLLAKSGDISEQELDKSQLQYEEAQIEYQRLKQRMDLIDTGYTDTLVEQARAEEQRIARRIEMAETRLAHLEKEYDRVSVIRAPADGKILDMNYKNVIGTIQAGEELVYMSIGDEKIVMMFGIQENFDLVTAGQEVRYKSQVYDALKFDRAEGRVLAISQIRESGWAGVTPSDTDTRYYTILASIEKQPKELKLDSGVTAQIVLRKDRMYRVFFGLDR